LAKSVLDRIVQADWWLSRCSGSQEWVKQDRQEIVDSAEKIGVQPPRFAHCNFTYIVDTADGEKAREIQHRYFREVMGAHRTPDQLETSYLFGSVDEIVARLADLAQAGCEYFVIGPTSDEPEQLRLLNDLVFSQIGD
jgi:alkanesulfonate monooxygenase SsuD/methylene tetrahydromethanopterin reductase-like flavin-dependent oxidoreductase (luciferase family)